MTPLTRAGMARVLGTVVDDLQRLGRKLALQRQAKLLNFG